MDRIIRNGNLETQYTPEDFINPTSYDPHDPKQRAYVVLNAGYVLGIVFSEYPAYTEQDALDDTADSGKLDGLQVTEEDLKDYETGKDSEGNPEYEGISHLGNASEPFADESLDMWVIPASVFAEDVALMRPERVMDYLEEQKYKAEAEYKRTSVDDAGWSAAYRKLEDLEDALTLARFSIAR